MIQFFVEDDKVMGGHSLRVSAQIGQSDESEVRGMHEKGIELLSVKMCARKSDYALPLFLFTDEEINIIEQIGLGES